MPPFVITVGDTPTDASSRTTDDSAPPTRTYTLNSSPPDHTECGTDTSAVRLAAAAAQSPTGCAVGAGDCGRAVELPTKREQGYRSSSSPKPQYVGEGVTVAVMVPSTGRSGIGVVEGTLGCDW